MLSDGNGGRTTTMAMDTEIREQLKSFIRESFFAEGFADEDSFLGTGIIDSLGVLQLVTFVESRFGVKVIDADLVPENFDSVARLARYVQGQNRAA
jgi:acyl carrier protein